MRLRIIALMLVAAVFVFGCQEKKKPAAVLNGTPISEETVQNEIKLRAGQHQAEGATVDTAALRTAVIDQIIADMIFSQGAKDSGIVVEDAEVAEQIDRIKTSRGEEGFKALLSENNLTEQELKDNIKSDLLKEKFAQSLVDESEITDEVMQEYYKESPRPFIYPATVNIRFVQAPSREKAEKFAKEAKGKKFDTVAEKYAKDKDYFVSNYGEVSPQLFSAEIVDALDKMKAGTFGGPYAGKDSYYVIFLKKRNPERPKSFDEAKAEIKQILYQQKRSAAVIHWIANKRKEAKVTIN